MIINWNMPQHDNKFLSTWQYYYHNRVKARNVCKIIFHVLVHAHKTIGIHTCQFSMYFHRIEVYLSPVPVNSHDSEEIRGLFMAIWLTKIRQYETLLSNNSRLLNWWVSNSELERSVDKLHEIWMLKWGTSLFACER